MRAIIQAPAAPTVWRPAKAGHVRLAFFPPASVVEGVPELANAAARPPATLRKQGLRP